MQLQRAMAAEAEAAREARAKVHKVTVLTIMYLYRINVDVGYRSRGGTKSLEVLLLLICIHIFTEILQFRALKDAAAVINESPSALQVNMSLFVCITRRSTLGSDCMTKSDCSLNALGALLLLFLSAL